MAIQYDLVKSNSSQATQYGVQITTGAIVSELQDSPGATQLDNAIAQVGWQVGTQHPVYPFYKCIDIDSRSIGPNEVEINYTFEYKFPQVFYEIGSAISTTQTNLDKDGEIITATYTYPLVYKEQPELSGIEFTTSMLVDKYTPETTITIIRQEVLDGGGIELLTKSKTYSRKVNSQPWTAVNDTFSRQWLCTGITGTSQDNGISYTVRYSFMYKPNRYIKSITTYAYGWDKEVLFIDPRTDQPPEDATPSVYHIYDEIDFNQLGLV